MEYVLAAILVLVLIALFVGFVTTRSRQRAAAPRTSAANSEDTGPPGIGPDATPLGDTAEHAGQQTTSGETRGPADAEGSGGTGRPVSGIESVPEPGRDDAEGEGRFKRDPIGGEGEGRPVIDRSRQGDG